MTPERFRGEEAVRQRPGFSNDHGQNRIVLECHPDQVVRYRGGKQPTGGYPERIDIRRPVEAEQRPFDGRIDDRVALHIRPLSGRFLRAQARAIFSRLHESQAALFQTSTVGD